MKKTFILSLLLSLALYVFISPPVQAAKCQAEKPDHAPDLFQIDVSKDSATLHFTPVNNAITNYTIAYGFARREDRFVVSFPFGQFDGVINYTVNQLSPNTKYYFRVRADNGCRRGYWSDTMSVETNWERTYTRVKGGKAGSNFSNRAQATPIGGFSAGPAAGFARGVLGGAATKEATPSAEATPKTKGVQEEVLITEGFLDPKVKYAIPVVIILIIAGLILWRNRRTDKSKSST